VRRIGTLIVFSCSIIWVLSGRAFAQRPEFETFLAYAQQAQARGDFEDAAGYYRRAVTLQPGIAELRANLGLMYYQTGKDREAIDSFLQAIHLNPGLFVPNLFIGLEYAKLKRSPEAIPYLKRAARIKPTDPQTQSALGQAFIAIGDHRLAITSYTRAGQLDPGNSDVWFHLGVAYLEQVEADARVLLARHKQSGYLHALVADTFTEQNAFIQAAEAYKTTLASPSFPSGTHAAYGFVLLYRHDFPGADRELNAELASSPRSLMAKLVLARLQIEQGEEKKAENEFVEIWKENSSFLQANFGMFIRELSASKMANFQRRLEEGRTTGEVPEEVVSVFLTNATGRSTTDLVQTGSGAVDSPVRPTTKGGSPGTLHEGCPGLLGARLQQLQARDLRLLASCAYSTGRYQAALGAAQKVTLNPATEAEGLYWETKAAQKLATSALARASAMDPNSPTLHVLLGDIYRQRKYYPDAEQEYRKALAIRPEDIGAQMGLSLALLADSEIEEAKHFAEVALKKNPDDPELNAVMGEILCVQHNFSAAESFLKKALNTKPELVPHVHALLSRAYAEANRTQEAISELKMGLADDKDGRLHYQLARLYLKVGDQNSARQAFQASERLRREGLTRAAVAMQQGENDIASPLPEFVGQ
jgi:tetratricopeptide (TPR) repeat protein